MMQPIKRDIVEAPSFMTKDPFFIPGYAGYCPQYKYRGIGGTYGHFTNEILTDPPWNSLKSVLQKIKPEDIPPRPKAAAIEELGKYPRSNQDPLIYSASMKTGYAGSVPHSSEFLGETFPGNVVQAVASFDRQQRKQRQLIRNIDDKVEVQDGRIAMKNLPTCIEASPISQRYGAPLPLTNARHGKYKRSCTPQYSKSPYDMDDDDPDKFFKSGHTGHVPLIGEKCGHTRRKLTNDALNELRDGRIYYRPSKNDDRITHYDATKLPPYIHPPPPTRPRSPVSPLVTTVDPKVEAEAFPVALGLPTTYKGHVQGLKDVVGMTFGTATRYLNKLQCPNALSKPHVESNPIHVKCVTVR